MLRKRLPDQPTQETAALYMNLTVISAKHLLSNLRAGLIAAGMVIAITSPASAQNPAVEVDVSAASPSLSVVQRYPAGSIQSVDAADHALAAVLKERSAIEAQFVARERACYPKFFTTACLNAAQEHRRSALAEIRVVEVEANAFKRRAKVAQRDKDLEDKRVEVEAEAEATKRAQQRQDKEIAAAKKMEDGTQKAKKSPDRMTQHQEKLKRMQAEEAANAQKRANNVAAHEKKVRDAEARQREVAAKKEEKERKRMAQVPVKPDVVKVPAKP
jgi:colicin import membrane protein